MTEQRLFQGDCLEVVPTLPHGVARLVYLDPPFFTQRTHQLKTRSRDKEYAFGDTWESAEHYADFIGQRLRVCRNTLSEDGSIFFHCDRRATHIVRLLLDDVFGSGNFRSEVVWHYRRWSSGSRNLQPSHQTLLYYSKSSEYVFNTQWTAYSPTTNVDQILQERKRDAHGKSVYSRTADGSVVAHSNKRGVPLSDVWDIPYLNPKAKERVGYPTQKPIALLERIIELTTNENDWVLDPFCGSGTTLVAAKLLGRNAYGVDCSSDAIALSQQRLDSPVRSDSRLMSVGRDAYRQADAESMAILHGLGATPVHRNKGIDAIVPNEEQPVLIRVQRPGESLDDAAAAIARAGARKTGAVMILVATNGSSTGGSIRGVHVVDSTARAVKRLLERTFQ